MKRIHVITLLAMILVLQGCGTLNPTGVYQGDKIAYTSELAIPTTAEALHAFVLWEYKNRAALASKPEIRKSADYVRAHAKQWTSSAINLLEAYKANPTPESKDALLKAISILRTAMIEASGYMVNAATPKEN